MAAITKHNSQKVYLYNNRGDFFILILLFMFFLLPIWSIFAQDLSWQRINPGTAVSEAKAIAIDEACPGVIYLGLQDALYKTQDYGENWSLLAQGLISGVNFLLIDKEDSKIIYAATQKGLFRSSDKGGSWQKIFTGKDNLQQDVLGIALCYNPPKAVFIATRSGVFFSPVNRIIWQKVAGKISDAVALSIVNDPEIVDALYVVTNKGVFKGKDRLGSYQRIYESSDFESEDSTEDIDSEEEDLPVLDTELRQLAVDPKDRNNMYLASRDGLIFSNDAGKSWNRLNMHGLLDRQINYILVSEEEDRFFLATDSGVFDCYDNSSSSIYKGMDFTKCSQLALDAKNNLYAACKEGFYKIPLAQREDAMRGNDDIAKAHFYEPTILQVQKEAVKYADVSPQKINLWKKQARIKALLPEVTLDYDKTVTTALGATYDRVQVGPRDWGLSLTWDLADMIYSSDQTSIDVRSRLMVELRDDVLNEVNRLFFERKRLKAELTQEKGLPEDKKFEKELRIEELTAAIDALTGGYLSRMLNENLRE